MKGVCVTCGTGMFKKAGEFPTLTDPEFEIPQQVIDYNEAGLRPLADLVDGFAKAEGLPAHGEAITARF